MERDKEAGRRKRFAELDANSRRHNAYYFTDFLTVAEASGVYDVADAADITIFGGSSDAERVMIRFGNAKSFGYEQDFPIVLLKIAPRAAKFADDLSHRDFLGTLMGLGIERDVIGDIFVVDSTAYVFVAERMADYIIENVLTVRHTSVSAERIDALPPEAAPKLAAEELIVASERIDGIIAKLYHMSRETTRRMFVKEQVLIAGRVVTNPSLLPKEGAVISVRGHGKFIYDGMLRATKKGNTVVTVRRYV